MTTSDGHVGRLVGKIYSDRVVFYGIQPLPCVKCTLENANKHQLEKQKHCKYCLNRLLNANVNYLITLIHFNTMPWHTSTCLETGLFL